MSHLIQLTKTIPSIENSIGRPPLRRGLPRKQQLPRTRAMWIIRGFLLIALALASFALSPTARAVIPAPDGGYPNGNTAEGTDALFDLDTGSYNTAIGYDALESNTTADNNTALGWTALQNDTSGHNNMAAGMAALQGNTSGFLNTADGAWALNHNTTGNNNSANGAYALASNTTGSNNIALGQGAGGDLTSGNNNIDIGNLGLAGEANTIRIGTKITHTATFIAGISGATVVGTVVVVSGNGRLGIATSSARFKDGIQPMDKASEAILALQPVTFRYKHELDPDGIPQFGLVAEQVEKVNPDLVARDDQGRPYTVRYEAVNAMLLNEFLKEHRKVQEQDSKIAKQDGKVQQLEAMVAKLQSALKEQAAQIQKVSEQFESRKSAPPLVAND